MTRALVPVAIAFVVVAAACAGARKAPAAAPRGFVGLQFLPSGDGAAEEGARGRFVPPSPRTELTPPEYPPAALAAGAGRFTVAVRIRIAAEDGRVTDVVPSPVFPSSTGPFEHDFRVAAERAVRLWRFDPGRFDRIEEGPSGPRVVESVAVPVLYDVRFDFDVDAAGGERGQCMRSASASFTL